MDTNLLKIEFRSCIINSSMEALSAGMISRTILNVNEGDLSHTSETICFSQTNENQSSDKESLYKALIYFESLNLN